MPAYKNISPKKRKLCLGDMTKTVTIQGRAIKSLGYEDVDYDEEFTTTITVRAAVQTTRGYQTFNEIGTTVGVSNNITHKIYIRFPKSITITSEDWVELETIKYDILDVENIDEANDWMLLYCARKGTNTRVANFT